jgi:tRNA(Ile)-lysidine synthase
LDYDKLVFPLTLRSWQEGDSFVPFGMEGEKKVSDFLIDAKYNLFEKERVLILQSEQDIAAVIGSRSGQRYAIGSGTQKILVAELAVVG